MTRVIGLISGTSVDGIDAALVEISGSRLSLQVTLLAGTTYPYPDALRSQILAVGSGAALSIEELASLDDAISAQFAQAALTVQSGHPSAELIGSHGQTVYHRSPKDSPKFTPIELPGLSSQPYSPLGYSLQLGRGAAIAHLTGIPTISNFRAADIAAGGEGAPLVPPVDAALLTHPTYNRCVQNLGGIGNVTYLPARAAAPTKLISTSGNSPISTLLEKDLDQKTWATDSERLGVDAPILGWDTGPGNMLIDLAVQQFSNGEQTYDLNGAWAATGTPCQPLVDAWLQQPFFQQPPPKSTGREQFGSAYLQQCLTDATTYTLSPADTLATLTEFTAATIAHSYRQFLPQMPDQVLLCGGGSRNLYLKQRLQTLLAPILVLTTDEVGLSADYKEAIAFAVLAYWRQQSIPGNSPSVTGARQAMLLGDIYPVI